MNSLKIVAAIIVLFSVHSITAQNLNQNSGADIKNNCEIDFKHSISTADLESFAKCFVYKSPEVALQSTLQTDQINFRKLPPKIDIERPFSSIQDVYQEPIFILSDYDRFENTHRASNLAFFEANRNSVLSAGYVIYPGAPQF